MAEEQLFRSAIGGFNKEDVIEYIDGINRAAAENQDWFDRQSKAMAETIKRLTQENNSLKSAATSNAQEVSRLQEELRRLQDEAQAGGHSDQEVADLKRQLAEQSEALEESERRFNAVIERGDGDAVLAEKYRALEADHKSLQSAYAELKAQSPAADLSKQEQMANALLRMRDELRAATDRETALEQQLQSLRDRMAAAAEEGGLPKAALDSVKVESEQQVRMIQEEYDALKADTDQKLQKAQAALIEAKNRIDGLEAQVAEANASADALTKRLADAQAAPDNSAELERQLESLRAQTALQVEQAQTETSKAQAEQAKAEALLAKEQAQHAQLEAELAQAEQKAENLFSQNKLLSNRIAIMQSESEQAAEKETDRLELETKLREAQDKAVMLEAENNRLQSLNDQLKKNENVPGTEELRILYDKSRLYDDIKNNVSRLVSDARRKAAELIYEAEQSSRQIMADGVASLTEMQRRIRAMQDEVREIQANYESATGSVNTLFKHISDTLSITDNHLISMLGENGADAEKPAEPDWPL